MASICLSICSTSIPLAAPPKPARRTTASASSACSQSQICRCFLPLTSTSASGRLSCTRSRKQRKQMQVVCMAPDEEKLTRRSPLDFPIVQPTNPVVQLFKLPYFIHTIIRDENLIPEVGVLQPDVHLACGASKAAEWERPKPGRRPDIFPQFSPMKTPIPPPLPYDPPEEDEEEEEEKKKEEEEEDPEKEEEPDKPEKQSIENA
ncbi:unnamed protein product [Dovyalis caffra]|uniref:Uncharacterized protein n=1 Tax=Dovyalis caffra TaxID=77055 RepID=A0AAV1RFK6_9ROSI|nr:unnamed protein product [Dovyalis caffra]